MSSMLFIADTFARTRLKLLEGGRPDGDGLRSTISTSSPAGRPHGPRWMVIWAPQGFAIELDVCGLGLMARQSNRLSAASNSTVNVIYYGYDRASPVVSRKGALGLWESKARHQRCMIKLLATSRRVSHSLDACQRRTA